MRLFIVFLVSFTYTYLALSLICYYWGRNRKDK